MSVRSCRSASLRLPRNPRIAARVLLKRANLSFVFMNVMTDAYDSLRFSAIFSASLLFTLLHSGAIPPVIVKTRDWMKTSLYVSHSLIVFILFLLFMLLVDLCQGLPRIWLWGRMCDPYVKEVFSQLFHSPLAEISNLPCIVSSVDFSLIVIFIDW